MAHFCLSFNTIQTRMQKSGTKKMLRKKQHQNRPGFEYMMKPRPVANREEPLVGKLTGKVALITGGDSGIGRAVAILFAQHGARIAISYLSEAKDADETK